MILNNKFKIKKAVTTLFGGKKTVSTVLYDFKLNESQPTNKEYLEFLIDHIKDNQTIKQFDIKTKNQHYLKQSVQKEWTKKIIIHNKNHNNIYSGFELLTESKFSIEKIGTSDHTFTHFKDNSITYNENGIVTLIEDALCIFKNKEINNIDNIFLKLISFFCGGSLYNRLKAIEYFSEEVSKYIININNDVEVNIDDFLINMLNTKNNKIGIYKSDNNIFSLNNEWSTKINLERGFFLSSNIIPITPKIAVIMASTSSQLTHIIDKFSNLEKNNNISLFLLLNAMLNEMERLYKLDTDEGQLVAHYFKNTIIGIPDEATYNSIKNLVHIENVKEDKAKEEIEHIIYRIINVI